MARGRNTPDFSAAWQAARTQFAAAEARFVDTLRGIADPDELGAFAREWYADPRPDARLLLHRYLSYPLNALRHEPLVKRLFKLAATSGDAETMAHFLVALDRTVRRRMKTKKKYTYENTRGWGREVRVTEESVPVEVFNPTPKDDWVVQQLHDPRYAEWHRRRLKLDDCRLFSGKTRNYLRRRAWRFFRKIDQVQPLRHPEGRTGQPVPHPHRPDELHEHRRRYRHRRPLHPPAVGRVHASRPAGQLHHHHHAGEHHLREQPVQL